MAIMFLVGAYALMQLNVQFFPTFDVRSILVSVTWPGASAEDVEESVMTPLEDEFRDLEGLKKLRSVAREGGTTITLEFTEATDMGGALNDTKERVSRVRNLPDNAEDPRVVRLVDYTPVARVLVTGDLSRLELRDLAHRFKTELLDRGVSKVDLIGMPQQVMAVEVPNARLNELGISLQTLGQRIAAQSADVPAGELGAGDVERQLRGLGQRYDVPGFQDLRVAGDAQGRMVRLGDVAEVELRPAANEALLKSGGQPAIELLLQRGAEESALAAARTLHAWAEETRATLPPTVDLRVFDERWVYIEDRIQLLVKNGIGGLILVLGVLFLFLSGRVAFWVAMGIPASFLAALAVLWLLGGSINMISLFALIMTIGIIVDDAIVVGEDALAHYESGEDALGAAEGGARRMLAPVMSSSLTTIAAFLPLMLISGIFGQILFDIPFVVICVILASLVEAFLVLPGHLRASFTRMHHAGPSRLRATLDRQFNRFRDGPFVRAVQWSVAYRWATLAGAAGLLIFAVALLETGRLPFTFFEGAEGPLVVSNAHFVAGTPRERVEAYLESVDEALLETEAHFGGDLIVARTSRIGRTFSADPRLAQVGEHYGSIFVELVSPDRRAVRNESFLREWQSRVERPPGLENLVFKAPEQGPPGSPIAVEIAGADAQRLKDAAEELKSALRRYPGVFAVEDDLPYGQEQWIYRLRPEAEYLGLTTADLGRQLRAAFSGYLTQIYYRGRDEIEVRVGLPESETRQLGLLYDFQVELPSGTKAPLATVAALDSRRGFETLRHVDGQMAVEVTADVDPRLNNANDVLAALEEEFIPDLRQRYGVSTEYAGRLADQAETLDDMKRGLVLALVMIYIILAWVFSSYGWPLIVMAVIPFGIIGAFLGHWLMGLDLTVLSLFGLFGLTGIVVNDSIILVTFFRQARERGMALRQALVEAARLRLRAVLLTSLSTIGGLLPLLFETSLQAQFLIPMAVSITCGLAVVTLLVLFLVPVLLSIHEDLRHWLRARLRGGPGTREGAVS
ncbi:efflux RND transporter permease subunit [Ectothiorhodospiraceae bacterium WFHF3C12]|nr:efflux RND transporter permease subunit [Ectothiorhodospiraceae bacterium WFHF3C12]